MKSFLIPLFSLLIISCSSAPSKKTIDSKLLSGQVADKKASDIEKALTLGANQLSAGYSAEATLITESLIVAQETEKGKMNMEPETKVKESIKEGLASFIDKKTCFLVKVHTYSIERAQFKYWVAKVKDASGILIELTFTNTKGVGSVPSTYSDINGRNWHNLSYACSNQSINTTKTFTLYLIPQLKNNEDQNETTELTWEIGK